MLQLGRDESAFARWASATQRFEAAGTFASEKSSSLSICYIGTKEVCTTTVPTHLLWHIFKCGIRVVILEPRSDMNFTRGAEGFFPITSIQTYSYL